MQSTGTIQEQSGYIDTGEHRLYATVFLPESGGQRPPALLFEPFGEEKKCAYRLLVRLARACARAGFPVIRFDAWGTGDSPGRHAEATWSGWLRDAEKLAAVVRETWGRGWYAIGARLGALLATQTAASQEARAAILIEPIPTGSEALRDMERRQKIKEMMTGPKTGGKEESAAERWAAGKIVDFAGFEIAPQLARELDAISLEQSLSCLPDTCALAALRVSGGKKLPPAWEPLVRRAGKVPPGTVEIVRDKPFWGQIEYYESDLILDRVIEFLETAQATPAPRTPEEHS